ncbi:MAG: ATP-binding cassette domain-containing protein [Planctomycetaceae bacterium]
MSSPSSDRLVAGSWILEQLSLQLPDVEMAAARRAWHEAEAAWPGEERQLWWRWLTEAARSIGLKSQTVDCTSAEVVDLVRNGTQVIMSSPTEDGVWLGLSMGRSKRIGAMETRPNGHTSWISLRQLKRKLQEFEQDGRIRCVVIRNDLDTGMHEAVGMSPLSRLQALLSPEWSDIWIVIVFAFVVGLLTLATPIAVESLVNTVAFGRFMQPVVVLSLILLTFLAFSAAIRALQTYVAEIVQRRLFARVSGDLAYRLPRTRTAAVDSIYLPELTNRFFEIVTLQKICAQLLLDGVGLVLSAIIGMAVLAFYHPWLLGFDIVMMAIIAFIIFVLGRGAVASAIKESKNKYNMAAWLEDISRCPTTFRTSGGTDLALERADRLVHEYLEARGKHFRILMRQVIFALGLQAVASTVLLGLGGWLVIRGELSLGQLVAAELIVTVIVGAFAKLGKHLESFYDLMASVDKLGALFDLKTEHRDGILELNATGPAHVVLESVAYRIQAGRSLKAPVSLDIPPRTSMAILGGAGSGKSTLLDLMYGLRSPQAGRLTIDGFNPQDLRSDVLRRQVACVHGAEIFHGSLEENVHLHRSTVTSADVRHALEDVGLYDDVLQLSHGFDTKLLGNGVPLSGTQQELLCIARAIAGRPQLLLLDGILDGLPDDALERVISSLLSKDRNWTLVIATGRKSIADRCDQQLHLNGPTTAKQTATKNGDEVPE